MDVRLRFPRTFFPPRASTVNFVRPNYATPESLADRSIAKTNRRLLAGQPETTNCFAFAIAIGTRCHEMANAKRINASPVNPAPIQIGDA